MPPILHADADSFFASVVLRAHPALRSAPMAVVVHGFVASSNYPARARGVTGGMLVTDARRRCPELALFDVPHGVVEETADALFDLFEACATAVEPGSMEEAFLDVGAADDRAAARAAAELRRLAWQELRIPVSVGVGRTKLMAKLASRAAKPDGLHVIDAATEQGLRTTLPVAEVWGVGRQTLERLEALGVRRLGDLDGVLPERLLDACGTMMTRRLLGMRDGSDDATVRPVSGRTVLSSEGAIAGYARRDWTVDELVETCIRRVCKRAMRAGLAATGLTIVLRGEAAVLATVKAVVPTPTAVDDPSVWTALAAARLRGVPAFAGTSGPSGPWGPYSPPTGLPSRPPPLAGPAAHSVKASLTGLRPVARVAPTLF